MLLDTVELEFGTTYDAVIGWETGDADNHSLVVGLADANQAIHFADKSAIGTDWDVSADSHPSVYIHSDTTPAADYLKMYHDGTNAIFKVAGGTIYIETTPTNPAQSGIVRIANNTYAVVARNNGADGDVSTWKVNASDQIEAGTDVTLGSNNLITTGYISIGSTVADSGGIRIPNNTYLALARNQGDDGNINMWKVNASDVIEAGASVDLGANNLTTTGYIAVGTTPAAAGTLRLPNDTYITTRNQAGGADINMVKVDASDHVLFGASVGATTFAGTVSMADQKLDFTTGYIEFGTTPADAGEIRQENNVGIWSSRNQGDDGNVVGWKVNAEDDYEAAADVNLGANKLYGGTAANADLELNGTTNVTVLTSYIVAKNMLDCTQDSLAVRVKAGSIGDSETNQTDLNGEVGIDSTNERWYFRYGAAWHYCAITAGIQVPAEEVVCPKCHKVMKVGDALITEVDRVMEDGALHAVWKHAKC